MTRAQFRHDHSPLDADGFSEVSREYSRAYIHHLFKAKEFLGQTLLTLHNLAFVVRLVDDVRAAMAAGPDEYLAYKSEFMGRYYSV